ncbi:hypothetical protein F5B18DRAFT_611820 [Nemania serpens]|nr:hypothetical protein F5B18DRAFT_611820 [Nemania serpens]
MMLLCRVSDIRDLITNSRRPIHRLLVVCCCSCIWLVFLLATRCVKEPFLFLLLLYSFMTCVFPSSALF